MTTTTLTPADEFEGFYQSHFAGTVLLVYSFTADMAAAQDVAQEAFARAWQRWNTISSYNDPLAWVRRVSINLANSRWRRLRTARSYVERQREEYASEVSPDHVMVVAALRQLPKNQREALVLHYLADMAVEDVAHHLQAPLGTVKSWLYRGRAALAGALTIDAPAIATPATQEIVRRGRARQRTRLATVTGLAALIVAFTLAIITLIKPAADDVPLAPTPSPSASLPAGCQPGQVPVKLTVPTEQQVRVNVFGTPATINRVQGIAQDLRYRHLDVGTVGAEPRELTDSVAVLRYGPDAVGAAHLLRAYLVDGNVTPEFDPDRRTSDVDLVVGGLFKQFATPTEMRQAMAALGRPALPAGTCEATE